MSHNPWEAGDFSKIAPSSIIIGEVLCDEIPLYAGQRVLDIGCGSGNTAMAAARRRADVTAVDPVAKLLAAAQERAKADGLEIQWHEGSAEALPFLDADFDVALSTFGMIFSTNPAKAVAEASRVVKPEGMLVFTSWKEGGLNARLFAACEAVTSDPSMLAAARAWGREEDARALLAPHFSKVRIVEREHLARAQDVGKWFRGMKTFLAPVVLAYEGLGSGETGLLDRLLYGLGEAQPPAPNGTFFSRVPYLEFHCER